MGLRMESGSRRSQVSEYPAASIPRCGPASPFKGHLSTKSNAFCIDSSRSLTSQYLIRDHMVFHYNKILSAKAAIDCSMPKSRLTSIKFADQQRREKLKKKIARCEEEMSMRRTSSRSSSRESGRLLLSSFGKDLNDRIGNLETYKLYYELHRFGWLFPSSHLLVGDQKSLNRYLAEFLQNYLEAEDKDFLFPCARQTPCLSPALCPYGERALGHSSPGKLARKDSQNPSNASSSNSSVRTSSTRRKHSGHSCSCSTGSFVNISHSQRCQGIKSKVCCGDLLHRHSEFFTDSRKPFTPRTLISDAKPFLSDYRYYTPARKKRRNHSKQHVEAQTQTDVISFPSADKASEREVMTEQQEIKPKHIPKNPHQKNWNQGITLPEEAPKPAEERRYTVDEPEREIAASPYSFLRETSLYSQQSSARTIIEAEEEEILYLAFIEDVTNEILSLGVFSDRALEQLFECHIQENKNRLDESKMRHFLDVLRADLGCSSGSGAEQIHTDWEAFDSLDLKEFDIMEELKFTSKSQTQRKAAKPEFFGTIDLLLKEPNNSPVWNQDSPVCRESSKEAQTKDDFSGDVAEMIDSGRELGCCVKSEEDPDTSPSQEATLNLITCDSDLEVNKELDDLEESFAEALQISHDYLKW